MIDLAPRPCDVVCPKGRGILGLANGLANGLAKRKLYAPASGPCKRRRAVPSARLVDLQILGEDGALVQEATIEEIWAPHATRLEIVVVDEAWDVTASSSSTSSASPASDSNLIDLDDPFLGPLGLGPLGPLGGTSTLHDVILREAQQQMSSVCSAAPSKADTSDSDFGNLDWLINFKVDSVFDPKKHKGRQPASSPVKDSAIAAQADQNVVASEVTVSCSARASARPAAASPKTQPPAPPVAAVVAAHAPQPTAHRYSGPGKPPFTYTELIELALKDKGKLTVKEIYQWITKHFPFYQASDERWKNSVRHNLSINPHFRKESKAPQGAGHLWVVMDNNNKVKNSWKEERIQNFLASQISASEAGEAAAVVATPERPEPAPASSASPPSPARPPSPPLPPSPISAGARSDAQLNTWWSERVSLERSAEEILSGVKREVGVEFLPMDLDGDLDTDDIKLEIKDEKGFLYGDLTAEQVIAESGLQDELAGLYLLPDMTSAMPPDSLFPDDLNFGSLELPLSG